MDYGIYIGEDNDKKVLNALGTFFVLTLKIIIKN